VPLGRYYALGVVWTNNTQGVKRVREGEFGNCLQDQAE
jgi:hypothetical protein